MKPHINSTRTRVASCVLALAGAVAASAGAGSGGWSAPRSAAERKNPVAPDARALSAGRTVYFRECAGCHGPRGQGDGKDGVDLDPRPSDLSAAPVRGQSDGGLFWKITTGRRPMPSFRRSLSDTERWQVVHFLRTLGSKDSGDAN